MAEQLAGEGKEVSAYAHEPPKSSTELPCNTRSNRKEKRKALKKEKRKQKRKELAAKERQEEEARLNDPDELRRTQLEEEREKERLERERKEYEEHERLFLEALAEKRKSEEEEEERRKALEEEEFKRNQAELEHECDGEWEYIEEGPPEIIWQGNEIIVKKKMIKVKKKDEDLQMKKQSSSRPTSNPLPPQSEGFADYNGGSVPSAQQLLEKATEQIPNFGTELDKTHCPFHLKTGACRFGLRCSRVHFYPDKSCTLLIKNMYNGPGLAWEQDEGLEYMDDEVERCYEEFYEDVHTEFLKFGEIVNFKVSKNGSFHLRGNVYVHYKSVDSAMLAYQSINGRYFAGKQVSLEFVGVTKWKVAICGEFMKSRLKTCTRGTACNFIHCFRNPGGDYEWADWDKPPPKYWSMKMAALFGYPEEYQRDKHMEKEGRKSITSDADRHRTRSSRSRERDSSRHRHEKSDACSRHHGRSTSWSRKSTDENRRNSETKRKSMDISDDSDSDRSDSEDYWLSRNKHKRNNNITREEMSSHQKEEHEVGVENVRKRTHSTSSSRSLSSKDQHRDVHSEQSKKSYRYRSEDRQYHDDYGKKTRESDSRNEDLDRYDGRRSRKLDRERDEESDSTSERARKRHKLSRWDPLNKEPSEEDIIISADETKHEKLSKDRSKPHDSESLSDRDLKKGRRSSDKRDPLKHNVSRKRSSPVDFDKFVDKSSTDDHSSEEFCTERKARRRRGHHEGVGSGEELEASKEKISRRRDRKHGDRGHRDREKTSS